MPRGKELSDNEVRKIWSFKGDDKSEREIASLIKCSKIIIHSVTIRKTIQVKLKEMEDERFW